MLTDSGCGRRICLLSLIGERDQRMKIITVLSVALTLGANLMAASLTADMKEGKAEFNSMGPIAFGPEGILFVADTKAAAVVAIATGDTKAASGSKTLKVEGINQKVAGLLGASADQVLIDDMAVNPISRNV